eukprot:jgi/Antlo1/1711/1569
MTLDYDYVKERLRILDDAYAVFMRFPRHSLDGMKEVVIQKHILKNPTFLGKTNFYEIAAKNVANSDAFREITALANRIEKKSVNLSKRIICPITKKEIVEFFYGDCGHPMERVAAELLCKSNPRPKCPHVGCNKTIRMKTS